MACLPSYLEGTSSLRSTSNSTFSTGQRHRLETCRIVGSNRSSHDEKLRLERLFDAQGRLGGNVERPNVVAELGNRRNPPLLGKDKLFNKLDKLLSIKIRQR